MKVTVSVSTYEEITEEADPDDSWDRANTEKSIDGWSAVKSDAKVTDDYWYMDETITVEVPEDTDEVFAVYVVYSTGDTFGYDAGQVSIADVFDNEDDAHDLRDKYKEFDNTGGYGRNSIVPVDFEWNGKRYGIPWAGYFEHLEHVGVETIKVESGR